MTKHLELGAATVPFGPLPAPSPGAVGTDPGTGRAADPLPGTEPLPVSATEPEPLPAPIRASWDSALSGIPAAAIRKELTRRQRRAAKLLAERVRIVAELDAVEAALDLLAE